MIGLKGAKAAANPEGIDNYWLFNATKIVKFKKYEFKEDIIQILYYGG